MGTKLRRLECMIKQVEIWTDAEFESLCGLAKISEWRVSNEKEFNSLVEKINFRLNIWPANRWQTKYERMCASAGAFVLLGDQISDEEKETTLAFSEMMNDERISELCLLLAEPIRGDGT